jgi:phenylacetate-CoA ligase
VDLFGRENPPMLFQYNAADYIIENSPEGELLFTILRLEGAAPKIRYNLRDLGGTYDYQEISSKLAERGLSIKDLAAKQSAFPILYVHGRGDLSVPFYGCKVFPSDLEEIVHVHPVFVGKINTFRLENLEDSELKRTLMIHLERNKVAGADLPDGEELREVLFTELCRVNQDFREVTKMFDQSCIKLELHDYETGPFAGRDIRIKNKYIA